MTGRTEAPVPPFDPELAATLPDRLAIHDLNTTYALVFDSFQLEESVNCWTEDGILDESETGFGVFHGRDAT